MALAPTASLAGSEPCQPLPKETMAAGQPMLLRDPVRPTGKGSDQKRRYVRGDATGLSGRATQALEKYDAEEDAEAILKRRLTRSTVPPVTALWGGTSAVTGRMKANTSSNSTWAEWPFFCSNLVKIMDSATRSVIHPKTRTAAQIPNTRD